MLDWLFHKESNDDWYVKENVKEVSIDELPSRIRERIRHLTDDELGLLLDDKDAIKFCPHCGTKVQTVGAKFCVKCGKSLVDD